MKFSKKKFESFEEIADFVNACESNFETRLQAAVDEVCSVKDIRIV